MANKFTYSHPANEVVQVATMEKPDIEDYPGIGQQTSSDGHCWRLDNEEYNRHLASLARYPCQRFGKEDDGKEFEEGIGFKIEYICPDCGGDGKETCHNPDHGSSRSVINSLYGANESACPVCGHDEDCKVNGGKNTCPTCGGLKTVSVDSFEEYSREYYYDNMPEELFAVRIPDKGEVGVNFEFEKYPELANEIEWFANHVGVPGSHWNNLLFQINNALKSTPSNSPTVYTDNTGATFLQQGGEQGAQMIWKEVGEIEGIKAGGCVPATIHYFDDKKVWLMPVTAPAYPAEFVEWAATRYIFFHTKWTLICENVYDTHNPFYTTAELFSGPYQQFLQSKK